MTDRIERLAEQLDALEADAMLVTSEINVRYLSGFTGDSSYLLVDRAGALMLSDGRYDTQLDIECPGLPAVIRLPSELIGEFAATVLNDSSHKRVAIESSDLTLASFETLSEKCEPVTFIQTLGVVERLRMIKDAGEIETTRQAVRIAEAAFESLLPMLSGRWTEREVAHELESKMRFLGASGCSFSPIVGAGPAGALCHYHPSDRPLGDAPSVLIDWGAKFDGYASDITRTLHREHASDKFRRCYEAVLEAQLAAIEKMGPGVAASDVDATARGVLERHGLADAFKHGLGHGTGLQIHETPKMSASSTETLAPGMIITVEPGVYFEGEFGIRIEDDILITETGREVLSGLPKGLEESRWLL